MIKNAYSFRTRERGAVLVVSMLLLLVMTVLALSASQATRLQERMAGNLRDHELAFQNAEAGLRAGERLIDDSALTSAPIPCASGRCKVYELNVLSTDVSYKDAAWWQSNSWNYAATQDWSVVKLGQLSGAGMATTDPNFFVEELEEVTDSLTVPPTGPPPSRVYYRITSTGQGGTDTAQVVLQTTFARRFN